MGWLTDEVDRINRKRMRRGWIKYFFLGGITALFLAAIVIAALWAVSEEFSVSVIRVEGTIVSGNVNGNGFAGSEYIGRELRTAADDPLVEGIVLRVNSPGGSPAAAQEIIRDIEYAKQRKPVVVSMGDIATSAGYHISSHADVIYANPDTMTGSIGTIWTIFDYSKSLEDEGVSVDIVKSGDKKDITSPYRGLTDDEREYLQELVNQSSDLFINDVMVQRGVNRSIIEDARPIRGDYAKSIGLVDEMGNLFDAINAVSAYP
ncbi:signal peptide peptidase SppA [Methanogenium cariaci]|jgi:protease IV